MGDIAIRLEELGKSYTIGGPRAETGSFREAIAGMAKSAVRRLKQPHVVGAAETFWALRDVSFEVRTGEVVGIIGRNGAGKSTLLRLLSRITVPSEGRVEISGRTGSLLEVGTGFHPELTGRENVYLNGAILGMKKAEIDQKLDEIIEFAGVERFIDTPTKRYSSGMYVRLAFSVAAHLEPDIFIVDEVLAVGDTVFQKKCLGRMDEVARKGRTVLYVSHNIASIRSLCQRAILLEDGHVIEDGDVNKVVDTYVNSALPSGDGYVRESMRRLKNGDAQVRRVELTNMDNEPLNQLYLGQKFRVILTLEARTGIDDAVVEIGISTLDGVRVTSSFNVDGELPPMVLPEGWSRVVLDLDPFLLPRQYVIDASLSHIHRSGMTIDHVERVMDFTVLNMSEQGNDSHFPYHARGFVRPPGQWHPPDPVEALGR